jgi:hypothetical protein
MGDGDAQGTDAVLGKAVIIVCVLVFLNEDQYLGEMLDSLAAQVRRADRLVLLDDGSTDGSAVIAERFAEAHDWAVVLRQPPRPPERDRLVAAHELVAFQWAVAQLEEPWDVVAKLDADLQLTPLTIETIAAAFAADDRLGMAGTHLAELDQDGRPARMLAPDNHVHGQIKFYRRACWEQIDPLPPILGWDTIDEIRAEMRGWRTRALVPPDGEPLHRRVMGTHDGAMRGFRRWGQGAWAYGEHPLHLVLVGVQRALDRGTPMGALHYAAGWAWAGLRRLPRAEPELRTYMRRDQMRRIRRRARTELTTLSRRLKSS